MRCATLGRDDNGHDPIIFFGIDAGRSAAAVAGDDIAVGSVADRCLPSGVIQTSYFKGVRTVFDPTATFDYYRHPPLWPELSSRRRQRAAPASDLLLHVGEEARRRQRADEVIE